MAEPDYDAAATEEAEDMLEDEGESDLDSVFLDHATDAGLSEEQARAMKLAIERCVELREQGAYDEGMGEMMDEEMPEA